MASFAVELRDVGKRFGSVVALDGVDLAIRKGEFFSLLGDDFLRDLREVAGAIARSGRSGEKRSNYAT